MDKSYSCVFCDGREFYGADGDDSKNRGGFGIRQLIAQGGTEMQTFMLLHIFVIKSWISCKIPSLFDSVLACC